MRIMRSGPIVAFGLLFLAIPIQAQQISPPAPRDATAISLMQKAASAMATAIPNDSSATGSLTIVEGTSTQNGTFQFLTRGTAETAEQITLPSEQRVVIFSSGNAKEVRGSNTNTPPLEESITDQYEDFPLPFLLSVLNNTDSAYQYIGQETLNGESVQHVKTWDTFASNSHLQQLAPFSTRDIWFDSTSGLPVKIAYVRQAGEGNVPKFPVELLFSTYTTVNGVQFPFQIHKSYNGTPWETISIQSVSFNTGLTDANFPVD